MIFETARLFLRELTPADTDALYRILGDAETMRHYPHALDRDGVCAWIARNMQRYREHGFGLWAVCLKETGLLIGDCGLTLQMIGGALLPEIGFHIRRDQQRRGYAKEAAGAVLQWALHNTDYPAFYSYCKSTNTASVRTAEAIGMRFDREYPDAVNGITHVSVIRRADVKGADHGY